MSASDRPEEIYTRRRKLEAALLHATKRTPNQCGLGTKRLQQLDNILRRKGPAPKTEEEISKDDAARRKAILEIIGARSQTGYDTQKQKRKWEHIVEMQYTSHMPLWQQRAYLVSALEERKDHAMYKQAEMWLRDRKALRRLLEETLKTPRIIESSQAEKLQSAFDKSRGYFTEENWNLREEATIYILRARLDAGLQKQPELEQKYGNLDLTPWYDSINRGVKLETGEDRYVVAGNGTWKLNEVARHVSDPAERSGVPVLFDSKWLASLHVVGAYPRPTTSEQSSWRAHRQCTPIPLSPGRDEEAELM